jgi:hypothetical protein
MKEVMDRAARTPDPQPEQSSATHSMNAQQVPLMSPGYHPAPVQMPSAPGHPPIYVINLPNGGSSPAPAAPATPGPLANEASATV